MTPLQNADSKLYIGLDVHNLSRKKKPGIFNSLVFRHREENLVGSF